MKRRRLQCISSPLSNLITHELLLKRQITFSITPVCPLPLPGILRLQMSLPIFFSQSNEEILVRSERMLPYSVSRVLFPHFC